MLNFIFRIIALFAFFLISIGTGGIKPCIFAFSGDQFQLPQQEKQLQYFTTKFASAVKTGGLISTFLMPELRQSLHCFGRDTCYPLVFGVTAVTMFSSIGIYYIGILLIFLIFVISHHKEGLII